jgi:hypothetical protein
MSWTDSDTIKKHLLDLDKLPTQFRDVPVALSATGSGSLPHRGIVPLSDKIKRLAQLEPVSQSGVQLTAETWVQLSYDNVKADEIVVAADNSLATVYRLGQDFAADFPAGKIRRISSGNISSGQSVQVYYQRYQTLTRNVDYTINYATGEIALTSNSALEPETTVCADYEVSAASGADQLISLTITETEDKILARLKNEYGAGSTDQGLTTGATELALAAVCRGLASSALSDGGASPETRARGWRELADSYEIAAWRTLRPFLSAPDFRPVGKQANNSWQWE